MTDTHDTTLPAPRRIQLSRAKGWRMPPGTVKVDRTTRWGNPFTAGAQGNAAQCVYWYGLLLGGYMLLGNGKDCCDRQEAAMAALRAEQPHYPSLRGKNLACWCHMGQPCHADLLLELVNRTERAPLDVDGFLRRYGWTVQQGRAVRLVEAT